MRLSDHWRQVALSLSRHKLRTALTAFGVFWGVFMVVLLLGIGKGLERGIFEIFKDDAYNSVWVSGGKASVPYQGLTPGRSIKLTIDDLQSLGKVLTGIGNLTPRKQLQGDRPVTSGRTSGAFPIMGVYPGYHAIERTALLTGRLLNERDVAEARRVAVIGTRVVELLFETTPNPVGEHIDVQGASYLVVGTFTDAGEEGEVRRIYIPYSAYQRSFGREADVEFIAFTVAEDADPAALESRVRDLLSARHRFAASDRGALYVYNSLEEYKKFSALFTGVALFTAVVGVGTLFAGLVGVGNIMLIAVRERTREIGVRKAVGATPGSILAMILQEALLLTAVSGYVGLICGLGAIESLRRSGFKADYFRDPEVDLTVACGAMLVLIIGGVIAGLIPARQAARVHPVEALRNE
jgi:putative ABC transport system permease protein